MTPKDNGNSPAYGQLVIVDGKTITWDGGMTKRELLAMNAPAVDIAYAGLFNLQKLAAARYAWADAMLEAGEAKP